MHVIIFIISKLKKGIKMNYKNRILLALILLFTIGYTQVLRNNNLKNKNRAANNIHLKEWNKEDRRINNPELQRLLEELKNDFLRERNILEKEFNQKVLDLKRQYSAKREQLKTQFIDINKKEIKSSESNKPKRVLNKKPVQNNDKQPPAQKKK